MANGTLKVSQVDVLTTSGTGTISIVPPATNTNRTLTLPDATTTFVGTDTTQTLTNKTITSPTIDGTPSMGASFITSGTAKAYNWNGLTNNAVLDFTGIPSWAKRVTVMFSGISTNGTSLLLVQLGTGSSPTYTTSGYLGAITNTGGTATNFSTGFMFSNNVAATDVIHGVMTVVNLSGNSWCETSTVGYSNTTTSRYGAGSIALSAALTAIRITAVNGTDTFDAGSINILYE